MMKILPFPQLICMVNASTVLLFTFCGCARDNLSTPCPCSHTTFAANKKCPDEAPISQKIPLDSLIRQTAVDAEHFVVLPEMLQSKSFCYLYEHPATYKQDILNYLQDTSISSTFKSWAIQSQSACDDRYFEFSVEVVNLFKAGKIGEPLMYRLIDPEVNTNHPYVRDAENARFRRLLDSLFSFPNTSTKLKGFIQDVRSNYICNHLELYR